MEKLGEQMDWYLQKIIEHEEKNHNLLKLQWLHIISGTSLDFHVILQCTTYYGKASILINDD